MSRYIDRVHIMNRIAHECHYDTEHPLESYAKLMQIINEEEGFTIKQYCRYCNNMCCGNANYCNIKKKTFSDEYIKRPNNCVAFEFNPIDALGINKKEYKPRAEQEQCEPLEGQVTIWEE